MIEVLNTSAAVADVDAAFLYTTQPLPHGGFTTTDYVSIGEKQPPYWDPVTTVFLSATMILFMFFALFGNAMVILVIVRHRGMRTRTNMFLCSLAVADLLTAVLLMPVALVTVIRGRWIFGEVFCQINGFLMPLFFVASIHTLMYISVHKYVTITRPFSAHCMSRRRILCLIAAAWFWALLTGYITVHGLNTVLYKPTTTQCGPSYPKDVRGYLHPIYMSLTNYLIPFIIMAFCYARIFKEMRAHSTRMQATSNLEKDLLFRQQRRITGTLIVVLAVFVLSWTPYILYSIYTSVIKDKSSIPTNLNAISYWFGYMNSACNPLIYALRSKAFRDGYKQLWCQRPLTPISEDNPLDSFYAKLVKKLFPTEPLNQYSTLHRLQAFIQNSLRVGGTLSAESFTGQQDDLPGSRRVSAGSIANFLIRPLSRKVSTSSLPESFRYATASLPRVSRDQRKTHSVLPLRQSAVFHPDSYKLLSDKETKFPATNGFLKLDEEPSMRDAQPKVDMHGERRVVVSASEPIGNYYSATEEGEDNENVFIVVADVEHQANKSTSASAMPSIHVSDHGNGNTRQVADFKKRFKAMKSVSVTQDKEGISDNTQLNRASSETNIQKTASPGFLRSLLKSLHGRSRDMMRSVSSSRRESSMDEESQTPVRKQTMSLSVPPWRSFLRSLSEDNRGHEEDHVDDGIHKAASESHVLDSHSRTNTSSRWWHKKAKRPTRLDVDDDRETSVISVTQTDEDRARLQRTWSEKPRLLRSMSIEQLDPQTHRRTRSFTPTRKKRKKGASKIPTENSRQGLVLAAEMQSSPDVEMDMACEMLKTGSQSMKDRSGSHIIDSSPLKRSWSDPCMPFQVLEHKVSVRRQLRRHRHNAGHGNCVELAKLSSAHAS